MNRDTLNEIVSLYVAASRLIDLAIDLASQSGTELVNNPLFGYFEKLPRVHFYSGFESVLEVADCDDVRVRDIGTHRLTEIRYNGAKLVHLCPISKNETE